MQNWEALCGPASNSDPVDKHHNSPKLLIQCEKNFIFLTWCISDMANLTVELCICKTDTIAG